MTRLSNGLAVARCKDGFEVNFDPQPAGHCQPNRMWQQGIVIHPGSAATLLRGHRGAVLAAIDQRDRLDPHHLFPLSDREKAGAERQDLRAFAGRAFGKQDQGGAAVHVLPHGTYLLARLRAPASLDEQAAITARQGADYRPFSHFALGDKGGIDHRSEHGDVRPRYVVGDIECPRRTSGQTMTPNFDPEPAQQDAPHDDSQGAAVPRPVAQPSPW